MTYKICFLLLFCQKENQGAGVNNHDRQQNNNKKKI
jgi:hypothetical protein